MQNVTLFSRLCSLQPLFGDENLIPIFRESLAVEEDCIVMARALTKWETLTLLHLWQFGPASEHQPQTRTNGTLLRNTLPSILKLNNKRALHVNARVGSFSW